MHVIPEALVEETWREVGSLTPDQAIQEMEHLGKRQPELVRFMLELTQDLGGEGHELAFYVFFVVVRMFEKDHGGKIRKIPAAKIIKSFEANQDQMERLALAHERFLERIAETEFWEQPYVLKYVVEALMEAPEGDDPVQLSEEDFGLIFLLLKTVIDVLQQGTDTK